ncbi:hypothetical protein ILUMI_10932, partial [Ignelater luminosus]
TVEDCWLISPVSVLIQRDEELIKSLFITKELSPDGAYHIRLCKDGVWTTVLIDDFVPCTNGHLHYANVERKQMWLPLLQKAAAKLYRCYESLDFGLLTEGFSLLTDAPCEIVYLQPISYENHIINYFLIFRLLSNKRSLNPMVISSDTNLTKLEESEYESRGLRSNHLYAVLDVREINGDRLIKLREPCGLKTWTGDWSNNSHRWTPSLKKQLLANDTRKGVFWIGFQDILKYFFAVGVCKMRKGWTKTRFIGTFRVFENQELSGISFDVTEQMEIDFVLHQENQRYKEVAERHHMDISMAIFRKVSSCPPRYDIVGFGKRTLHPILYHTQTFEYGKYILVPMSFNYCSLDDIIDPSLSNLTLRDVMVSVIKRNGKVMHVYDEKVQVCTLNRLFCGIAVLVENYSTDQHVHIKFDTTDGFNIVSSRGDTKTTVDSVPPQHGQLIGIYTQRNSEEAFSSKNNTKCKLSDNSELGN